MAVPITIYITNAILKIQTYCKLRSHAIRFYSLLFLLPTIRKNNLDIFTISLKYTYRLSTFVHNFVLLRRPTEVHCSNFNHEPSWKFRLTATSHNEFLYNILSRKRKRSTEFVTMAKPLKPRLEQR